MNTQYTVKDVRAQIKPLSDNAFVAFFQKIWRWWLGTWYGFADKQPKLAKVIYEIFFFMVFSNGVTIFQILVLIFLPQLLGLELAAQEFMIPKLPITVGEFTYNWSFLGNEVLRNQETGAVLIGGGLGYFIAFKIATFLAQCINFPLQRNITYKSKGNPWVQAMWYFIGWVLINLFCDAINNLWIPIAAYYFEPLGLLWLKDILAMVAQGGVAMAIFFFIFMVIFPDLNKMAANATKKVENLKKSGASAAAIKEAEKEAARIQAEANLDNARRNEISASTLANAKAISWDASEKLLAEMKADKAKYTKAQVEEQAKVVEQKFQIALEATANKFEAEKAYKALKK